MELNLPELIPCPAVQSDQAFRSVRISEHISLLPSYVGRIAEGVIEHLNNKVLSYSPQLHGVMLSYSKPVVLQSKGRIYDEHPHIHLDISYTAYVFRPLLGGVLYGTVNKMGVDHIGCLAYDCFNVSIITGDIASLSKKNGVSKRHRHLEEGAVVKFRVVAINVPTSGEVLSLTGELVTKKMHKKKRKKSSLPEEAD